MASTLDVRAGGTAVVQTTEARRHGEGEAGRRGETAVLVDPWPAAERSRLGLLFPDGKVLDCGAYPSATQGLALRTQDSSCSRRTSLDWLPGRSTLFDLVTAARDAGFRAQRGPRDRSWRYMEQPRRTDVICLGWLLYSPGEFDWDAEVVDHGVIELSFTDWAGRVVTFTPFVRLANDTHLVPNETDIFWAPQCATVSDLLSDAFHAGYSCVWRMDYPGNARWGWLPVRDASKRVDQFYMLRSLGFNPLDLHCEYHWRAERVRPGCVRCSSHLERKGSRGPVIYLAHIETTLSGYVPIGTSALAWPAPDPPPASP